MYTGITPLLFLGAIVGFWAIIFATAVFLTRRFLRGIGERLPEETNDTSAQATNGGH